MNAFFLSSYFMFFLQRAGITKYKNRRISEGASTNNSMLPRRWTDVITPTTEVRNINSLLFFFLFFSQDRLIFRRYFIRVYFFLLIKSLIIKGSFGILAGRRKIINFTNSVISAGLSLRPRLRCDPIKIKFEKILFIHLISRHRFQCPLSKEISTRCKNEIFHFSRCTTSRGNELLKFSDSLSGRYIKWPFRPVLWLVFIDFILSVYHSVDSFYLFSLLSPVITIDGGTLTGSFILH